MSPLLALFWVLVGIALLVLMNLRYKFHNIFALLIAGIFVAVMEGIPLDKIVTVIQDGLGSILGHLALIIIFGAVIGKFMTESGASQQIADDIVQVYLYGILVILPALFCAGILLPKYLPGIKTIPLNSLLKPVEEKTSRDLPSFGISILIPLIPAVLMIVASIIKGFMPTGSELVKVCTFLGSAEISMLLATLAAVWFLGVKRGMTAEGVTHCVSDAIAKIANVLFVISAGGILKQVIVVSGVGDHIVTIMGDLPLSPFIVAWIITAIIRILTGQGAVAAITSAGIVAPMVSAFHLNPALMCLAVACGSNTITLMYDGGFLLFKETFGISMKDTFKTWGLLELINSVVGLGMVLVLSLFIS